MRATLFQAGEAVRGMGVGYGYPGRAAGRAANRAVARVGWVAAGTCMIAAAAVGLATESPAVLWAGLVGGCAIGFAVEVWSGLARAERGRGYTARISVDRAPALGMSELQFLANNARPALPAPAAARPRALLAPPEPQLVQAIPVAARPVSASHAAVHRVSRGRADLRY